MYSKLHAYAHRLVMQPTIRQVCLLTGFGSELGDAASSLALQLYSDDVGSATAIDGSWNHLHAVTWRSRAST